MIPLTAEEWSAVHGAGQACIAYLMKVPVEGIWIEQNLKTSRSGVLLDRPSLEASCKAICGGFEAEILFGREEEAALQPEVAQELLDKVSKLAFGLDTYPAETQFPNLEPLREEILRTVQNMRMEVGVNLKEARPAVEAVAGRIISENPIPVGEVELKAEESASQLPESGSVRVLYPEEFLGTVEPILGRVVSADEVDATTHPKRRRRRRHRVHTNQGDPSGYGSGHEEYDEKPFSVNGKIIKPTSYEKQLWRIKNWALDPYRPKVQNCPAWRRMLHKLCKNLIRKSVRHESYFRRWS